MDEFLVLLQATLDEAKSKSNINADIDKLQNQLDKLKIQAELDPKTTQKLADDIGKLINQKIVISNIGIDTKSGIKAGQEYGKQIRQGISQGIKENSSVLNSFKKSLENIGMGSKEIDAVANRINNLGVQIETLNQTQSVGKKDVLSVNIAGIDQYGQAIKLTQQYNTSTGELINTINNVSTVQQKAGVNVDNFAKKQSQAVNNLTNQINQLNRAANDPNASRPITDTSHLSSLSNAYNDIISGIERMKNASSDSFTEEQNNVKTLISNYKSLVSEFRNAENIATQMKSTDISSGIAQAQERLGKLKANSAGFEQMSQTLRELDVAIENVGDKSSLDKFIDDLRVAESQLSRVKAEAKQLSQVHEIQLSMDNGHGASEYQNRINAVTASLEKYGVETQEAKRITDSLQSTFDGMKGIDGQKLVTQADKLEQEFKAVKASVEQAKIAYDKYMQPVSKEKASSLINRINSFLSKNTRITNDAKASLQGYVSELERGVNLSRWNEINGKLKDTETSMRGLHRLGASLKDQMSQTAQSFTQWLSVSSVIMLGISKTKEAISELIELDNILTEISKTSNLTNNQLKELGDNAFESASKYGRSASDYLTGVQEMYRAGFSNAEEMAELSLLAQAAGDMASNSANDYLMATNAAYNYKGNAEELNRVLDSQNYITNNAAVSMQDMADATSEAASIASQYGVQIDELSALIAVATSKTRESGAEVGTALKSIFVTLQDTTSKPVVEAFDAVGISMTKIVNGAERLKTPIELLKELSVAFKELPEGDTKRANILTDIGKKYHANTLSAILSDWESYESMLDLYSQGMGSAAEEAEKSANNIEGSLKRLGNTWTDTIENVIHSDSILFVTKSLNGLLSVINNITSKLGSLGTIGLGAGLFAGVKNIGKTV